MKNAVLYFLTSCAFLAFIFMHLGLTAQSLPQQVNSLPQPDYSDELLERFVVASLKINEIQQDAQLVMVEMIESQGLNLETFNQLAAQQRNPDNQVLNVSDADKMAFAQAMQQIQSLQLELQQEMESAIIASDLQPEEYNQIMQAYQQHPEIQNKVRSLMQE